MSGSGGAARDELRAARGAGRAAQGGAPVGVEAVLERARALSFLGPGPVAAHVEHSRCFAATLREAGLAVGAAVCDLGSGAGIPGLVLALEAPEWRLVLLESSERRCQALREALVSLGLEDRASVLHARAEDAGRGTLRGTFDAVVARSFGPPAATAECAACLLRPGGLLVVSEPAQPPRHPRWPAEGLELVNLAPLFQRQCPYRLQVMRQIAPCPERFPRRSGVPAKRPLF